MSGKDEKIGEIYSGFMRRVEQINKDRVNKKIKMNKSNKGLGLVLATFVGSVYFYSMFAVKQETFMDQILDIDESENVNQSPTAKL